LTKLSAVPMASGMSGSLILASKHELTKEMV